MPGVRAHLYDTFLLASVRAVKTTLINASLAERTLTCHQSSAEDYSVFMRAFVQALKKIEAYKDQRGNQGREFKGMYDSRYGAGA